MNVESVEVDGNERKALVPDDKKEEVLFREAIVNNNTTPLEKELEKQYHEEPERFTRGGSHV